MHVLATLAADTMMPAVRAHMLFAALGDHGELISCAPAAEEVELFDGRAVEAWLISEHEEEAIGAAAREISEVESVECERGAVGGPPRSRPGEEPVPATSHPVAPAPVEEPAPAPAAPEPAAPAPAPAPVPAPRPCRRPRPCRPRPCGTRARSLAGRRPFRHPGQESTRTVRVDAERLDSLMHLWASS